MWHFYHSPSSMAGVLALLRSCGTVVGTFWLVVTFPTGVAVACLFGGGISSYDDGINSLV